MLHHSAYLDAPPRPQVRVPSWLLVLVPTAGWLVLLTADTVLQILDSPPGPGLHGAFIGMAVVIAGGAGLMWLYQQAVRLALRCVELIKEHVGREVASIDARRCCCTEVTEPLRVVATASIRTALPTPAELAPRDNLDPVVIDMARRVQDRLTRGVDQ